MWIFMDKNKWLKLEKSKLKKSGTEGEEQKANWFTIGSFQRTCMVCLSYILMLVVLCTSFFAASYLYWFGGETADTYWETERLQERLTSKIRKAAPAVKHCLLQGIQEDDEMVEIYTLETEDMRNGEMVNSWKKTTSYTCESGAEIAGFQTNFKDDISESRAFYKKKNDSFLYADGLDTLETNFAERWESQYRRRETGGVQKYCAVSRQTMREWMLNNGKNIFYNNPFYYDVPHDARYLRCIYHYGKGVSTILCYSKKKDRWYYLNLDEDDYAVEKTAFRIPDMVYFPLYGIAETEEDNEEQKAKKTKAEKKEIVGEREVSIKEFSDGFSDVSLFLQNGKLFSRMSDLLWLGEDDILRETPFFNLKIILYEAGKEYYHQKELLRYIDKKMGGFLWSFTFHSDSGMDVQIGSDEGMMDASNIKQWEFFVDFQETTGLSEEPWLTALAVIGKQQGYRSMTVKIAIPQYSIKTALFSHSAERRNIRYNLEAYVFSVGAYCWGAAVISLFCWLYLIIRLLFGKENAADANIEVAGTFNKSKKGTFSLERLPIELWLVIIAVSIFLASVLTTRISQTISVFISVIFLLFFDITLAYFLFYAVTVSLIRLIRKGMLWNCFLTVRGWKWFQRTYKDVIQGIWKEFGYRKKTIFLSLGYIFGTFFFSIAGILLVMESSYHYSEERWLYLLIGILFAVFLLILQLKAVSYVMKNELGKERIVKGIRKLSQGNLESGIDTKKLSDDYLEMAQLLPKIQDGLNKAVQKSLRDERMKTELITNVSHDIKTPLTSIINYIDLLKRAKPQGENVDHYLEVLTQKSQRLRQLIEDLVEASKASSGALPLENRNLDFTELIQQATGEFQEKLAQKKLQVLVDIPQPPVTIFADGRRMFRILENLLQNVYKYALEGTRVYFSLTVDDGKKAVLTLRNISAAPLNITEEELIERFVRGEESRTTEGSGLGLSIAKDLARLQGGEFSLKIDGDLFKVILIFPIAAQEQNRSRIEE